MKALRDGLLAAVAVAAILFALILASEGQPRRAFGVTEVVRHGR